MLARVAATVALLATAAYGAVAAVGPVATAVRLGVDAPPSATCRSTTDARPAT